MDLGENIYRLRKEKGLSQDALAEALEVSRQSVSKWENNASVPELEKLVKMSEIFGVTLDELVGRDIPSKDAFIPGKDTNSPIQQVIIQNHFRPVSARSIIGIILICIGLLILPLALSATAYKSMCSCMILCGTFALCGISTLLFRFPYIVWGWILLGAFALYIFLLTHWEASVLTVLLILLLAFLLLCTIAAQRKGKISVPAWLWWAGGLLIAGLLILLCINILPQFWISTAEHAVTEG